jgi:membrane-associated protein
MTVSDQLIEHSYALIFPLAIVEGPVISIAAGLLAARGLIDWYWALPLLIAADLIGDISYYWIGRAGKGPLAVLGERFGISRHLTPDFLSKLKSNAPKMLLIGKWTHAIGALVLVGSGMLRIPLGRFVLINLAATIPKSTALFGVGYVLGYTIRMTEPEFIVTIATLCALGATSIAIVLYRAGALGKDRTVR